MLWASWRRSYVRGVAEGPAAECLFCRLPAMSDEEGLILERTEHAYSVLNRFPYTSGHLMVAPYRHVATPTEVDEDEQRDMWRLLARSQRATEGTLQPHGYNLGANLGRVAGAGVPGHFHLHLVPRWDGDTNFMSIVGSTRVHPEALQPTWVELREALSRL